MFVRERLTMKAFLFLCVGIGCLLLSNGVAKAAGTAYVEKDVSGGGTVEGTVKWSGDVPEVVQLVITKNTESCGGETKPSPRLVVSSDKGIKDSVVYIVDIKEGKKLSELSLGAKLNQVQCQYEPRMFVVPMKTKFEMTTSDDILHNIHMFDAAKYNLAFPIKGQTIKKKLRKPGVVEIVCDAGHYWMSAYIHVVQHPYYAITDADGKFKIDNVPPGTYKLAAWHEGWKVEKKIEKDGKPSRLFYAKPVIIEKEVNVGGGDTQTVDFEISD